MSFKSSFCLTILAITFFIGGAVRCDELVEGKDFVYVARDGGAGGYEAFPDVARLADGRLLCVFYDGDGHVAFPSDSLPNGGRVSGCFSEDEGKTWSEPFVVFDSPFDDRDPGVTVTEDGTILVNFFLLDNPVRPHTWYRKLGTWYVQSTDGGKTWSRVYPVSDNFFVSSPIRILRDGRWAVGLYNEEPNYEAAVAVSDDQGKSWKTVVIPTGDLQVDAETDVVELSDGSLLALMRNREGKNPMAWSRSSDRGETWTVGESTGFTGHCPYLHLTPDGTLVMAIRTPPEERTISYEGIIYSSTTLRLSPDEGKTWGPPTLVDRFLGAYPSLVNLKDGTTLIVYYEEGRGSSIRARKFHVNNGNVEWDTF
ncbi:MAG: sialidase family protein [Planctomycetia bacterium]|nr:sialidase family protein [Planctomycetia bacterium]